MDAIRGITEGMHVLVINSGSSSMKFSLFETGQGSAAPRLVYDGAVSGIGGGSASLEMHEGKESAGNGSAVAAATPGEAMRLVMDTVTAAGRPGIDAVGYRVVHPGATISDHTRLTPEVLRALEGAAEFAPLHDPAVLPVIRAGMERFPQCGHFACFDTVFHRTMPAAATTYPLPEEYRDRGVKRYGFHGLSCESVVRAMRLQGEGRVPERMVIAHLGSGCSVTALRGGRSVDTSMGLTPTGGVVMGTRPGDLDPGLMLYLVRAQKGGTEEAVKAVEAMVNHASGMVALSGQPNDMKAVRKAADGGDARALLALEVFTRAVRKAIGSYSWLLGGLDAIVFTGGIGEHDARTRAEVLEGLDGLGVAINSSSNEAKESGLRRVDASESETAVYVIEAQEDLVIAEHVQRMAAE